MIGANNVLDARNFDFLVGGSYANQTIAKLQIENRISTKEGECISTSTTFNGKGS